MVGAFLSDQRGCASSLLSLCDGRSATNSLSFLLSVSRPCPSITLGPFITPLIQWLLLSLLSPLSLSLSLIRSCSVFNIQTYHKTSESRRVCLIRQFYKYWQIEAKTAVWQNLIQSYIFLIRTGVDFWFAYVDLCPGVYGIQVFIG